MFGQETHVSRIPFDVETLGAPQQEVAFRLRAVREAHGLSLRDFAERLTEHGRHVSHTAVAKYERGELKITPDYLELVSGEFGVPYGWFLSGIASEDDGTEVPSLGDAGLDFLPKFLRASVRTRLDLLADWCGIPPGPLRISFYQDVGAIIRAPLTEHGSCVRPWQELSERELSVYLVTQFATLRTLLRRWKETEQAPQDQGIMSGPESGHAFADSGAVEAGQGSRTVEAADD